MQWLMPRYRRQRNSREADLDAGTVRRPPRNAMTGVVPTATGGSNECTCRLLPHPSGLPPIAWRVGIRDFTFEACSGFTHVTARPVAQPPKAAFVTRLR